MADELDRYHIVAAEGATWVTWLLQPDGRFVLAEDALRVQADLTKARETIAALEAQVSRLSRAFYSALERERDEARRELAEASEEFERLRHMLELLSAGQCYMRGEPKGE